MKTKIFLLSLTVSGIKNIEKNIKLEFYKKTLDKNFDAEKYRVKAIYGENGSGKTGIVTAVYILKELLINNNYLNETSNQVFLQEIVNKKTHTLHLECEFLLNENNTLHAYCYEIELSNCKNNRFEIIYEHLCHKTITSKNATYDTVFECKEGELVRSHTEDSIYHELKIQTANLLKNSSFSTVTIRNFLEDEKNTSKYNFGIHIIDLFVLGFSLIVNLETEDLHKDYLVQAVLKSDLTDQGVFKVLHDLLYKEIQETKVTSDRISKKSFHAYKEKILKMERFLRLFKEDIKSVDIDKTEDKNFYICQLLINYGEYSINTEFESTGIKKLIRIFESLQMASKGGIAFIDEMDSNINDVYLCKLVEYMMLYGKGQLCFTTHNTSPMSILKKGKKSIDFLSNDNHIVPWTTNGNYQPDSLYKHGLIQYLPFNIEPEDFIGILGD